MIRPDLQPLPWTLLLTVTLAVPAGAQIPSERIGALVSQRAVASLELLREYLALPNDGRFPEDIDRLVDWLTEALDALAQREHPRGQLHRGNRHRGGSPR